jgi:hypothetical protein
MTAAARFFEIKYLRKFPLQAHPGHLLTVCFVSAIVFDLSKHLILTGIMAVPVAQMICRLNRNIFLTIKILHLNIHYNVKYLLIKVDLTRRLIFHKSMFVNFFSRGLRCSIAMVSLT